jgi:glycosyltransferase involved in cell wall biosynthesis
MVLSRIPSARFLLIGEGELKNEIEHLVDQRQLRSRFIFAGAREDVLSLYPLFDICVLPSLWESLPYSMLEAMAAGKAIVATRVGGMPEAIAHGQTGYLIPPKDPAALADAIVELLKDGRRRDVLGSAARDAVRIRYPLDRMVRSVEDLYTRVLDAKRSGT